ncbi:MAG: lipase [Gammaproteobacteria bacterium]|nr:lipase [Gammaproteobacteria bacterium]
MRLTPLFILLIAAVLLFGCKDKTDTPTKDNINTSASAARFDPSNGILPFPNDLLFVDAEAPGGFSADGTLNIPTAPDASAGQAAVIAALNGLDGFSTIGAMTATFAEAVDSDSLIGGDSVRLYEVTKSVIPGGAVTGVNAELVFGVDYVVSLSSLDTSRTTLVITPLRPLKPDTGYLVVLTNGITNLDGQAMTADLTYGLAKSISPLVDGSGVSQFSALSDERALALEPLRQLTNAAEIAVTTFSGGLERGDIILSWSFTTQSIADVLSDLRDDIQAGAAPASVLVDTGSDSPMGGTDIYAGTIDLPYYLSAPSETNPTALLTGFWQGAGGSHLTRFNTTPVATSTQTVPLLVSIPKVGSAPWPTVIYQHGITDNRTSLLALADSLAQAGFAVVAIDLPLHGLTGNETNGTEAFYNAAAERTFNVDFLDNATGAPGADGIIDASGAHFINLSSLLTNRDNVRQAVADLMSLTKALETMDYDGGGADFDTANIRFVAHSLGAIVGGVFLALEPSVGAATLAMPGGGIAKVLDGSARFGPVIAAGLGANGITKGSAEYESFLASAQMALDSADPINYAAAMGANRGLHLIEVVGGSGALPDQVIPNNVLNISGTVPSPTAGTDPLAILAGMSIVDTSTSATNLQAWVRFSAGHHASPLSPDDAQGNPDAASAAVTTEMQTQIATFMATNGTTLTITDSSVIETP